jgi:hypothetical protein
MQTQGFASFFRESHSPVTKGNLNGYGLKAKGTGILHLH